MNFPKLSNAFRAKYKQKTVISGSISPEETRKEDELMSRSDNDNRLFLTKRLQENDMFQGWTKTGWTLDHSISFCVCALRTIEPLQSDSRLKTNRGNQRWHTAPFDIQRAAYITCINGFGQDWCKRVCWQAAISCPTVSFVRFLRCNVSWGQPSAIPSPPESDFLSTEAECPHRHRNGNATQVQHSALPYGAPEARWTWSAHTYAHLNQER